MNLLLDTHIILWAAGQPEKLSESARSLLMESEMFCFSVQPVSGNEVPTPFNGRVPSYNIVRKLGSTIILRYKIRYVVVLGGQPRIFLPANSKL